MPRYQINIITPLGTLVSEEYEGDHLPNADAAEMHEFTSFAKSENYWLRLDTGELACLGESVQKNSILLVKILENDTDKDGE